MLKKAFTLVELLVVIAVVSVLSVVITATALSVFAQSSLAISADNIRQLNVGGSQYLTDHNNTFWPYAVSVPGVGTTWWFGYETAQSIGLPEGQRTFDPSQGPLGGYIPKGIHPDPSYVVGKNAFKPKYKNGYIGVGYNVLLGGAWQWNPQTQKPPLMRYWQLSDPGKVVVFATSAQVNNFQSPASASHPMIEEFYGLDSSEQTIRFYAHGYAMVGYASGSAGFLPMDPTTLDTRMPTAEIGRFAPAGNTKYLQ